jgi:hypothetical protein
MLCVAGQIAKPPLAQEKPTETCPRTIRLWRTPAGLQRLGLFQALTRHRSAAAPRRRGAGAVEALGRLALWRRRGMAAADIEAQGRHRVLALQVTTFRPLGREALMVNGCQTL